MKEDGVGDGVRKQRLVRDSNWEGWGVLSRRILKETNSCSFLEFYDDELPCAEHDFLRPFPVHSPSFFAIS